MQRDRRGNPIALVLAEDGSVDQRTLETARAMGSQWLIDSGLSVGDRLIVEGIQKVRAGAEAQGVDVGDQPAFAALVSNSSTTDH